MSDTAHAWPLVGSCYFCTLEHANIRIFICTALKVWKCSSVKILTQFSCIVNEFSFKFEKRRIQYLMKVMAVNKILIENIM